MDFLFYFLFKLIIQSTKAAAEKKLNNIYKIFEEGEADEFDRQRLNQIKVELREINKSICEISAKSAESLDNKKIVAFLTTIKSEIFVKNNIDYARRAIDLLVTNVTVTGTVIKVTLSTQNVCAYLVPRTRIAVSSDTWKISANLAA